MITSRGLNLLRTAYINSQTKVPAQNLGFVRLGHHAVSYRKLPPEDKKWAWAAEFLGGVMWWWVLWHFWHDWGHLVGEFPYPDVTKWTDEELGIPPDDADD
ncbi:hypothetical protein DMN91_010036 [Ooceraea biroi]|uniref:NADH dehydrogenase [ubiquinone] 1 beta subcomplex subunit 2, mitochondrial n=1 Tax=Ooceraea biroi TaxID=2015173 RepID=A0A026W973_OOCBI|nr:NADH dehydrogenase [ubiquinone] 1 beta subcomplex subunit 2, mitochondrial [Ooceraea biroi]EZA52206.1 NADH dehydrogenase [ubiquinone] 1 beta subcomplex subunit 2, mitochondrial [Ooceraea biroi]RLU17650.1 hypothetical protein DMN91_009886 [Ooceraea biroi]RLU17798.1 hypothetical protein DMN91_010036 [Ooceraea biroi]